MFTQVGWRSVGIRGEGALFKPEAERNTSESGVDMSGRM